MEVVVDGLVWMKTGDLTSRNLENIRRELTIIPRKTTDIDGAEDPDPIFMFEEDDDRGVIGVPRGYYLSRKSSSHDEIVNVSLGNKMRDLKTRFSATGPYVEQETAISALMSELEGKRWGGVLLRGAPGSGKALAHGEPVLTPDGHVPVESIEIGGLVAGTDGGFYPVTGVFPQGERDLYRVTFTDKTHVDCDGDHLWTFEMRRRSNRMSTFKTSDLVGSSFTEGNGKYPHKTHWLPPVSPVEFDSQNLPVDPYTLGVFLGDGGLTVKSRVYLTTMEQEIVDRIRFPYANRLMVVEGIDSGLATSYRVSRSLEDAREGIGKAFVTILSDMGLMGCGSHSKFVPREYKFGSSANRLELLRGLFDTDGSPDASGCVEYSTVSKDLADSVCWMVASLGGTCVTSERETPCGGKWFHSYRLRVKLPCGVNPFHLHRKAVVVEKARWQRRLGRAVVSVESVGKGLATCISVDSPNHLFLTRNCVPTHNTVQGIEFARRIGRKTLILVHKEFLLRQWKKRLEWQLPGVRIGLIRQGKCEYDQIEETGEDPDFVIGMLQSLSRDVDGNKYPKAMWTSFGLIISDEVHRVGAGSWAPIIPRFNAAYRLGLTATPSRKDGAEDVFFLNISKITYSATSKMMMPKLRRVITTARLKPVIRGEYRVSTDNLNSAQIINQIAADEFRSRQIVDDIVKAVAAGRKILVVSERLEHLRQMSRDLTSALFDMDLPFDPKVDYYTGQWFTSERWEKSGKGHKKGDFKMRARTEADLDVAERANVIFCTSQMMSEGLDITASDVLVMATPISDIVQLVGRVQRWCFPEEDKCKHLCAWRAGKCKGKPDPIVVDVIDDQIPQLKRKWIRRQSFYRKNGAMK